MTKTYEIKINGDLLLTKKYGSLDEAYDEAYELAVEMCFEAMGEDADWEEVTNRVDEDYDILATEKGGE